MATRLELQVKLETLLGSRHVYYQPPESVKMEYPAIRYSKYNIDNKHADNINYLLKDSYEVIVIDSKPDNVAIKKILDEFPMSSYNRHYVSDNLNHDVIRIYF